MVRTVHVATAADPATSLRPLSRAAYDLLVEQGQFDDARVELLEGVLVEMPPMSDRHARAIALLDRWLQKGLPDRFEVRAQLPFAASDHSEPEPDLAVTDFGPPTGDHPARAHLVIEVTLSTHHTDLVVKPRLYGAAGVPRYWVLDLRANRLVEHTGPTDDGYRTVAEHDASAVLHVEDVAVPLAELFGQP